MKLFTSVMAVSISVVSAYANDIVLENGRVIDSETGLDAIRNVAIHDGRISAISEFPLESDVVVDASDLVVAPGFIDLHAHGMANGDMRMQAMQGVTTILELESGVLPIVDWYDAQAEQLTQINYGASAAWTFGRIATFARNESLATPAYFQDAQAQSDWQNEIATAEQSERILSLVEQGLKEGGLGIGINAGNAPGYGQKEYFALAKLAKEYDVATYSHVRYIGE